MKIGTRTGKMVNVLEGDLKTQINELSVDQNEDSHPDLTPEARAENNGSKIKLDYVQLRAFEPKTLSGLLRIYK